MNYKKLFKFQLNIMLYVLLVHPDGMPIHKVVVFYRTQIPTGLNFTCRRHGLFGKNSV